MEKKINHNKIVLKLFLFLLFVIVFCRFVIASVLTSDPYKEHGALSVKGNQLVDEKGRPFVLKGVSTDALNKYPQYVNKKAFRTLRDRWGVNVIRLPLYTEGHKAYLSGGDQVQLESVIDHGVRYCSELGLYCIIDWHTLSDYNPNIYRTEAVKFFDKIARRYRHKGNVIYEICNEPSHGTTWRQVKYYAKRVIPAIRKRSPKSLILVGTPMWCQDIDVAAADPIREHKNIMYTCHFYAATHKDEERAKLKRALEMDCPVFISEFGISEHTGDGKLDYRSGEEWKKIIRAHNLSYVGWNLNNKDISVVYIKKDCKKLSGWDSNDLTPSGNWVRNMIRYPWPAF